MSATIPFGDFRAAYVPAAFEPEIRNRVLAVKTVAVIACHADVLLELGSGPASDEVR